jgi:hypothetical protein
MRTVCGWQSSSAAICALRLACPAQKDHLGVTFPLKGSMMAPGQPAHQAFFLRLLRPSRLHLLGHLSAPPFGFFSSLYFITIEERSTRQRRHRQRIDAQWIISWRSLCVCFQYTPCQHL